MISKNKYQMNDSLQQMWIYEQAIWFISQKYQCWKNEKCWKNEWVLITTKFIITQTNINDWKINISTENK